MVKLMVNNSVTTYMYLLNYTIQGLDLPAWLGNNDYQQMFFILTFV